MRNAGVVDCHLSMPGTSSVQRDRVGIAAEERRIDGGGEKE